MVVYLSDKYCQDNPEIHDALVRNKDRYISNDLIFDLAASIMGISGLPGMDDNLNLADKSYSLDKKSVLTMYGKMHIDEIPEKEN